MKFFVVSTTLLSLLSVACGAMIEVTVGGPGVLKYNPPVVNASIGDIVRFTFRQKNHTVTESTFESPCLTKPAGFDTGFIPIADTTVSGFPVADLTIRSLDPVWIYCRQSNHCQQGMVFAVNPGNRFAEFLAKATAPWPLVTSTSRSSSTTTRPPVTRTTSTSSTTTTTTNVVDPSDTPSPSSPVVVTGVEHRVLVGNSGFLSFTPTNITANVGDMIVFEFRQKNHTVTASSFDSPCSPLSLTSTNGAPGFDSGFVPVDPEAEEFPTFSVQVNDTNPIWVYCKQGNHCGQGMVFSANAEESGPKSFDAFYALARQSSAANRRYDGTGPSHSLARAGILFSITFFLLFV